MRRVLRPGQLNRLSEFTANLGLVFFASAIAPLFSLEFDPANFFVVIFGVVAAFTCLLGSLLLIRRIK